MAQAASTNQKKVFMESLETRVFALAAGLVWLRHTSPTTPGPKIPGVKSPGPIRRPPGKLADRITRPASLKMSVKGNPIVTNLISDQNNSNVLLEGRRLLRPILSTYLSD